MIFGKQKCVLKADMYAETYPNFFQYKKDISMGFMLHAFLIVVKNWQTTPCCLLILVIFFKFVLSVEIPVSLSVLRYYLESLRDGNLYSKTYLY